jgi:hypothetical protein
VSENLRTIQNTLATLKDARDFLLSSQIKSADCVRMARVLSLVENLVSQTEAAESDELVRIHVQKKEEAATVQKQDENVIPLEKK